MNSPFGGSLQFFSILFYSILLYYDHDSCNILMGRKTCCFTQWRNTTGINVFHSQCNLGNLFETRLTQIIAQLCNITKKPNKQIKNPCVLVSPPPPPSALHQCWTLDSSTFKAWQKMTLQWVGNIGQCLCCLSADIAGLAAFVDMNVFIYTRKIWHNVCSATAPCLVSPSERHRGLSIFQQPRVYHSRSDTPNAVSQTMRLITDSELQMKPHPAGKCTIHKLCRQERSKGNNWQGWWTC